MQFIKISTFNTFKLLLRILNTPLLLLLMPVCHKIAISTHCETLYMYQQTFVFFSVVQWVQLRSTDPQVLSYITAQTFDFISTCSGKFLKVIFFFCKIESFPFTIEYNTCQKFIYLTQGKQRFDLVFGTFPKGVEDSEKVQVVFVV